MDREEYQYSIINKDGGLFKDWSFLLNLYAPIIGPKATTLYFSLVNEETILRHLNYPKFELTRLYQMTSMDEKNFNENIKKLESLKLVKSKIARNKKLKRFELFAPLEPSEFFANEIFERTLLAKIGLENLEALKFIFKEKTEIDLEEDFEDVTATFEDVFPNELREAENATMLDTTNINNLRGSKRTLFEKMFNLVSFNAILKRAKVNINYNSQKNKKAFNWALSLYNFNENDFANLIIQSFDFERQLLDFSKFEIVVQNFILDRKKKNNHELNADDLQKSTPEVWAQKYLNQALDLSFYKLLKKLREDYHFENLVINSLMDFSCFVNQGKVIPNYIYKIADTIMEHQMFDASTITRYLTDLKIQKQNQEHKDDIVVETDFKKTSIPTYDEVMNLVSKI